MATNSANREDWDDVVDVVDDLRAGRVDLLLVSPERLTNLEFRDSLISGGA